MVDRPRRQPLRKFHGLFRRVARKRRSVFDNGRRGREISQRQKSEAAAEDGMDFARFVGVARGDEQRDHSRTINRQAFGRNPRQTVFVKF